MAVRTITYRELTPDQRAKAAKKARERLLGLLNNPFLSIEQRQAVYAKIGNLTSWEKLQIEVTPRGPAALPTPPQAVAALPPRSPQHHDVSVGEKVGAGDKVS